MSSHRLHVNQHWLRLLASCSPKERKALLAIAPPDLIKCLAECIFNTASGNTNPIPREEMKKAVSIANKTYKTLRNPKISNEVKRQKLIQNGGFLPIPIIAAIVSGLSGLAGRAIGKAAGI